MRIAFVSITAAAAAAVAVALAGCATNMAGTAPPTMSPAMSPEAAKQQVADTERAFARTMADRDLNAFASFVSEDTVFFAGAKTLHGKKEVVEYWAKFYKSPAAPFSWRPEQVEVLAAGNLGLSAGPVFNPKGEHVGCYQSIWRLEAPGQWKIVFDKGGDTADCKKE